MDTMWEILGIKEGASVGEIRAAYANRTQTCHPEEKPEEFAKLQKAYKDALKYAKQKEQKHNGQRNSGQLADGQPDKAAPQTGQKTMPSEQSQATPLMDLLENTEKIEREAKSNTPAMQQFKAIFNDEQKRQNRMEWRTFFISEVFLDEQYEESFVHAMHAFLRQQDIVPYTKLPDGLVVELAIVYVLWPKDKDYLVEIKDYEADSALYDWKNVSIFEETAADIWNQQENCQGNYMELYSKASFIRRKSYDEYRTIRKVVLENSWEYKRRSDDMEEYKYTLSMAHWEFIADDDKVNSMDIDDIRLEDDITHACEVELYDYLLRKYGFPIEPCAYMYKYFALEDIENTEFAEVYKNLKAHILEQYPDMNDFYKSNVTAEDYADDLRKALEELQEKYGRLGWGKNIAEILHPCYSTAVVDWCDEEAEQVYGIVQSPLFQKYKCAERVVSELIVSNFTVTQARIFYDIYNEPKLCFENSRIMRLVHDLFRRISIYGRQEEYLAAKEFDYNLDINSYDFWEYFLTAAFGDRCMQINKGEEPIPGGYLYFDRMMLPAYIKLVFKPSLEWRLRFTNYDKEKGSFGAVRNLSLQINENLKVTIAFHLHYVRYYINEKELLAPAFDAQNLLEDVPDDTLFLMLLPAAQINRGAAQGVFDRLTGILPRFVRCPAAVLFLATMIANDNASDRLLDGVTKRQYIENLTDCYRLDSYQDRRQRLFHFHQKYGCWEYVGKEMIGLHFRSAMMDEQDAESWDMDTFTESDLSLPYEVETKVHDVVGLTDKEKVEKLLALFQDKDAHFLDDSKVVLVFGDKNRIHLRQHFSTGVMLDKEMEEKAYKEHRYLEMHMKDLMKFAKKDMDLQWKGWMELENFHGTIPICMGASGNCYAYGVPYGKGTKAKDFAALLGKLISFEALTQIIEYEIVCRSEWD